MRQPGARLVVAKVREIAGDGSRAEPEPLQVPGPAETGHTERMSSELLAIEGKTSLGYFVQHEISLGPCCRNLASVDLDVKAMAIKARVRAVG